MVDRLGDLARSYWPVALGVIAAAIAWGVNTAQLSYVDRTGTSTLSEVRELAKSVAAGQATLAAVQATGAASVGDIAELRTRVHALEVRR